jgi:hemerythrin-like metal-binding protein
MMWKDSYRLGVDRIDEQHMELFRMTEDLLNAVRDGATVEAYQKALGFLKDYVIYHFRDEEAYQASIHCSDMQAHKEEHRQFTQTVLDYEKRLKEDGFSKKTMKDLAGTVTAWLIYHVVDTDQKMIAGEQAAGEERHFDRCVDLFSGSALEVMETMAGLDRSSARMEAASPYQPKGDIFVKIELVGDMKGAAVFGFSKELALNLIRSMTMMELDELDELVQSALCELTNISCGNAATALTKRNIACDIKTPVVSQTFACEENGTGVLLHTAAGWLEVGMFLDDPAQQILP